MVFDGTRSVNLKALASLRVLTISCMLGIGCVSTTILLLTSCRSTQTPGFFATTIGETPSEASIGSIMPSSCKRCNSFVRAGHMESGMFLTLCWTGVSFQIIWCLKRFTVLSFCSKTSGYSSTRFAVVCKTGCESVEFSMMFSFFWVGQPRMAVPFSDT